MQHIKNIIFDLGGVIINLDVNKTISEFNKLSYMPFEAIYTQAEQSSLFDNLDKGLISDEEFFYELRQQIRYEGPDHKLFEAWNAMLLDVPEKRLDILVTMKQNYNTFLLSNTNEPHVSAFEHDLYLKHGVKNFKDYFDEVYYSCRVGMRKPNKEIFEFVLKANDLKPEETVFIDDSIQHVRGAGECGISAFLLPKNEEIGDFLKGLNLL
ncbi:MAG: HAD family phosphatase [Bacteroidetes bacterium]|nr:HAD family phosphatase [Bacteroidota bacterium]